VNRLSSFAVLFAIMTTLGLVACVEPTDDAPTSVTTDELGGPIWATNTNWSAGASGGNFIARGNALFPGTGWGSRGAPNVSPYYLTLQGDGNVVLYNSGQVPLWATNTFGRPATHLYFQPDGNLVLYNGSQPLWASNTDGRGGVLVIQNDGNVVIYHR